MTEFAGFVMPLFYSSILAEHMQVRRRCGVFDVSHMGRFLIFGENAVTGLDRLVPTDLSRLAPGQAAYTLLLNHNGGILDDLIVYRCSQGFLLVVNAGNREKDWVWISSHLQPGASLADKSEDTGLLAVQGPRSFEVLHLLGARLKEAGPAAPCAPEELPHFTWAEGFLADREVVFMHTGYTGEDGVEILCQADDLSYIWDSLLECGQTAEEVPVIAPCGLGARDSLRLEAALPLWGHELDETTLPMEAGLGRVIDVEKRDFVGRDALIRALGQPLRRVLVGLRGEGRNLFRHGDAVIGESKEVGFVTSGGLSPVLGCPIALAYVTAGFEKVGSLLEVRARGRSLPATVVRLPFYKRGVAPLPPET